MALLIIDNNDIVEEELRLHEEDFPANFVDMKHPEDGIMTDSAIVPERIRHQRAYHHRLLLRVSFKLANEKFVPFTFVCDTGAPDSFYLSRHAYKILEDSGRIMGAEMGNAFMTILDRPVLTKETPLSHQPANIIGLKLLEKLGLSLDVGEFSFQTKFDYF